MKHDVVSQVLVVRRSKVWWKPDNECVSNTPSVMTTISCKANRQMAQIITGIF